MNPVSDERFLELAMKLIGFECTAEEKAELHRIIDQFPERREQLQKRCISAGISRELLPLLNALEATEGKMTAGEMDAFKAAVAKRREQKKTHKSGSRAAGDTKRTASGGPSPMIDVEPGPPAASTLPPHPGKRSRQGIQRLIVLGVAVALGLTAFWFRNSGIFGGIRWKFAIVQPMFGRSDEQVAPLRRYLHHNFSNVSVETMKNGGREMRDWESSKTRNMVQVKCILEGIRGHQSWLVARFEVKGWRENGVEFQKIISVQDGNWTLALEQVRQFVRDY
jgi:hypothetical protein